MSASVSDPPSVAFRAEPRSPEAPRVPGVTIRARALFGLAFVVLPLVAYALLLLHFDIAAAWVTDAGLYAALATIGWRLARRAAATHVERSAPLAVTRAFAIELGGAVALFSLFVFLGFRGFLSAHGVPAFRQDWAWPADDDEMHAFWSFITADWTPAALGHTKPYPTLYVMFGPLTLLGRVLHPKDVLALFFGFCEIAAGVGAYALSRIFLRTRIVPAAIASAFYAAAPYMVDKVVGGHIHVVLAYALLPWTLLVQYATDRAPRALLPAWIAVQVVLLALAMSALTFVAFDALAMSCVALALHRKRRALIATGIACALAFTCNAQSIYHLGGNTGLDSGRAAVEWLRYLSVDSPSVLSLLSYLPAYARAAMPAWIPPAAVIAIVPCSLALIGWAASFAALRTLAFALVAVLGVVGTSGVIGPFAPLKELVYGNVRALAAFREFYNMQALELLGLSAIVASALDAAWRDRPARIASTIAASAFVAIATAPYLSGGLVPQMPYFAESQAYRDFARRLVPNGGERIAMFPFVQPVRRGDVPFAGVDVFPNGFRGHPTLAEWHSEPILALAALYYERGDVVRANRIFDALGVRWLLLRKGLTSALPSFWYPHLFPATWEKNDYYRAIAGSPDLTNRGDNDDFTLLENTHAVPIVSLAPTRRACDGSALLVVAEGACPRFGADPVERPRGIERLALPPDRSAIDPGEAWTTPGAIFSKGPVYAASTAGVGTVSGAPYTLRFTSATAGRLFVRCASDSGVRAYLNGASIGSMCATAAGEAPRWFGGQATRAGSNVFVAINGGGTSVMTDALVDLGTTHDVLAVLSTFWWAPPYPPAYQRARVTVRRPFATSLAGTFASEAPATLVFSDDFDPGWKLALDGGAPQDARAVNGGENGFDVPAGRHRFAIAFVVAPLDRALGLLEGAMWPALAATIGLTALVYFLRRARAA